MQQSETTSSGNLRYDSATSILPTSGGDALEILLTDHQTIKALLQTLTSATAAAQRRETLEKLKAALTIHNATEENLVYPALEVIAGKKHEGQKLYHETAAADVVVFMLDTMLKTGDEADFEATAKKLQGAILEHIEDEETSAFPHLREKATPEQSALLTQSVRTFRSGIEVRPAG